jgi:hypothetical protein
MENDIKASLNKIPSNDNRSKSNENEAEQFGKFENQGSRSHHRKPSK